MRKLSEVLRLLAAGRRIAQMQGGGVRGYLEAVEKVVTEGVAG